MLFIETVRNTLPNRLDPREHPAVRQGIQAFFIFPGQERREAMAHEIRDNTASHRFELEAEGKLAYVVYVRSEGAIEFKHTLVPAELEGKGIGSALAKYVLEYAKAKQLEAIVTCPFIKSWQARHPE
jgi:uncharacterized protein